MTTDTHAIENAQAWLENIVAMVKRLEHAQESCHDYDECKSWIEASAEDPENMPYGRYHDADAALEAITESPLSVEVRADWHIPGSEAAGTPEEYKILLTFGGPALRIIGKLDQSGEPESARLEYQDWGTPWTNYGDKPGLNAALLTYARQFYYGS